MTSVVFVACVCVCEEYDNAEMPRTYKRVFKSKGDYIYFEWHCCLHMIVYTMYLM